MYSKIVPNGHLAIPDISQVSIADVILGFGNQLQTFYNLNFLNSEHLRITDKMSAKRFRYLEVSLYTYLGYGNNCVTSSYIPFST